MLVFPAAGAVRARKFLAATAIALACAGAARAGEEAGDTGPETTSGEPYVSRLTPAERRTLGAEFYRRLSPYFLNTEIISAGNAGGQLQNAASVATGLVSGISDGQILLMDMQLDQFYLPEPLPVEKRGDGFLIRLEDLIRALDFPIEVDEAAGRANGWFIRQDNLFQLDLQAGFVRVGERRIRIGPHMVERRGEQIWISNVVAADWFSIEFLISYRQLLIILKPAEMLPIQLRLRRANMRIARPPRHAMPIRNPYIAAPRPLIAAPSFDTQLINSLSATNGKNFRGTSKYAVKAKAPLLGGALDGFISGDNSDAVRAARFSLGYKEPDGIFGIPVVTQVTFGDVYSVRTSLLGSGRLERGVYMSNLPLGRQINLDTTTIAGNSFPGYDVQLFRGAALIGSQEIGEDGRYEFDEVPVFPGINEFLLVFHSPQGQVIEETQIVNVDPALFAGSRLVYELSLTDQNRTLLDDTITTIGLDTGPRAAGRAQYTLGGGFALEAGFESLNDVGQRRTLGYAGLSQSSKLLRTRAVITADLDGNVGLEALVQARLGKLRARLEHRELGDIGLAGVVGRATRRFSRVNVTGSLRSGGTRSPLVTYDFFGKREEFVNGELIEDLGVGLGTRIIGFSLSTNVAYRKKGSVNNAVSEEVFAGTSQITAARGRWQTRIRSNYEFSPRMQFTSLGADIGYRITDQIRPQARIQHETVTNLTSATAFLNYDAGFARISPSISYDTANRFAAFVTVRFSTTREPETGKWHFLDRPITEDGHLSALVFLDENENGRLDAGEQVLDNVEVAAIHQRMSTTTNARGIAFFPRLRSFERTDVEIVRETLPEPTQAPAQAGWSIMPRPGVTQKLELPVVRIWSIRGSLVESQGQSARGFSGLPVRLRDLDSGEVVAETRSDSEGGFEIRDIRNGKYRIELDNELLREEGFQAAKARYVSTTKLTAEYTGIDLVSAPSGMVARYPSMTGTPGARSVPLGTKITGARDTAVPPYHALLLGYSRSRLGIALSWVNIRRRAPQLFAGLRPIVNSLDSARIAAMPTQRYPLRVGPIPNRDDAEILCDLLRHNRIPCRVVPGFELPMTVTY